MNTDSKCFSYHLPRCISVSVGWTKPGGFGRTIVSVYTNWVTQLSSRCVTASQVAATEYELTSQDQFPVVI
jgi:hypothetical protein